ncbi:hypothetical protein M422DRAFT_140563, partial [Sphaerobolus stellatus SS14]
PLVHTVIAYINTLTEALDEYRLGKDMPAVHIAAAHGRCIINKYYARTDETIIIRIAIILFPPYKSAFFHQAEWEDEWIDEAINLVRQEWKNYKPQDFGSEHRENSKKSYFDKIDSFASKSSVDELEQYLSTPTIALEGDDPIKYWSKLLAGGSKLARMALDFLTCPATSVYTERSFSWGSLTVTKKRHSLSDDFTCSATVLSSWSCIPDLIPADDLIQAFNDKSIR